MYHKTQLGARQPWDSLIIELSRENNHVYCVQRVIVECQTAGYDCVGASMDTEVTPRAPNEAKLHFQQELDYSGTFKRRLQNGSVNRLSGHTSALQQFHLPLWPAPACAGQSAASAHRPYRLSGVLQQGGRYGREPWRITSRQRQRPTGLCIQRVRTMCVCKQRGYKGGGSVNCHTIRDLHPARCRRP